MVRGKIWVIGLGPGHQDLRSLQAGQILQTITDVVGYHSYVSLVPQRAGLTLHASDNGDEDMRAGLAIELAGQGKQVAIVSGGDAGIFGMAATLFAALHKDIKNISLEIIPGISALTAAAARIGAPLGSDFCAVSLSDNLRDFSVIERRLRAAVSGDFVIIIFNPASKARPRQIFQAFDLLKQTLPLTTEVVFAKDISRKNESIVFTDLAHADPGCADMATLIVIGSQSSRRISVDDRVFMFTPRST